MASLKFILLAVIVLCHKFAFSGLLINGTTPACQFYSPSTCSQTCGTSTACSTFSCRAPYSCNQTAYNASYVPNVLCASENCVQTMNYTNVGKMHAVALRVSQKYTNPYNRLNEMFCIGHNGTAINSTAGTIVLLGTSYDGLTVNNTKNITTNDIFCNQSCNWCGNMTCEATKCEMISENAIVMKAMGNETSLDCTECKQIDCSSNKTCNTICRKQCNITNCNSETCNMLCMPDSQCPVVECGNKTTNCILECQDRSTCDLNCTSATNCKHLCAKSGVCYTRIGESLDLHNGQCGNCNCSRNIRRCTQRCEASQKRCLELYCDAKEDCNQYSSSSTSESFVYRMLSYSPKGSQTCDNRSSCWQMVCRGTNCSLSCVGAARCDYMICKAKTCVFNCHNGSHCDVMTCLEGSESCIYNCDASSTCRIKKCKGKYCIGAARFVESTAIIIRPPSYMLSIFLVIYVVFFFIIN